MRPFNHINATTLEEASEILIKENTVAMAGGGDLLGTLKDNILPIYPKTVVNLKSIEGLDKICEDGDTICIGALATLADIAENPIIRDKAPALAEAAGKASSPSLRETTTIGGNLCQMPRCWYYRKLNNRFDCARKGGDKCFAISGDNRYHSVFGGATFKNAKDESRTCFAVNQCELAPVLIIMGAKFITTMREIDACDFHSVGVLSSTILERGEILTEIRIPVSDIVQNCKYVRFAFRKSIDFPVINLAFSVDRDKCYRICLGGVAPVPYIATAAQEALTGLDMSDDLAANAGVLSVRDAKPFEANAYKLQLVKTLVKRGLQTL